MQNAFSCGAQPSDLLRRTRIFFHSVRVCICHRATEAHSTLRGALCGHSSVCGTCCTDTALESRKSMQIDTESQLVDDKSTFAVFRPPADTEKDIVYAEYVELYVVRKL